MALRSPMPILDSPIASRLNTKSEAIGLFAMYAVIDDVCRHRVEYLTLEADVARPAYPLH
jgi:hypothetical protein